MSLLCDSTRTLPEPLPCPYPDDYPDPDLFDDDEDEEERAGGSHKNGCPSLYIPLSCVPSSCRPLFLGSPEKNEGAPTLSIPPSLDHATYEAPFPVETSIKRREWPPGCPCYLGLWICAVCCRSGRDLRGLFCKVRTSPRDGVR